MRKLLLRLSPKVFKRRLKASRQGALLPRRAAFFPGSGILRVVMSKPNLESLIETLAAKVHQSWMEERRTAGWTYGEQRDDRLKHTPCLVTYDALPESEKDVDRRVVRTVVQALTDPGYPLPASSEAAAAQ